MAGGYWIAMLLAAAGPAPASAPVSTTAPGHDIDTEQKAALDTAAAALLAGRAQAALDAVAPVVAAYRAAYASEPRKLYCGMSSAQTIAYMGQAAGEKRSAVALSSSYCDALYIEGYALVDLGRLPEARAAYEAAVALAPMHSHFLTELGQTYRPAHDWPKMLELCERAQSYAGLAIVGREKSEQSLAWRCMGYALTELGRLDESEALYRKCLEVDPNDAKAKSELSYIAAQRRKQKPAS